MKLYLSSYGLGNEPQKMLDLLGDNKLCAVIANAQDHKDKPTRTERLNREITQLAESGITAEELDLRSYFEKPSELNAALNKYGLLWVRGGNVFVLRRAMAMSGMDQLLPDMIRNDTFVYAGYSAGACVLAPDMHGIEIVDDPNLVPSGYTSEIIWEGLNVLPYMVAPHYKSDHPESADIDKAVEYFEQHAIAYKPLRDGEAIVIRGSDEYVVGLPNS